LRQIKFIMPFHPRTIITLKTKLEEFYKSLLSCEFIKIIPPASFLEMIMLEKNCRLIITDSSGVQKESHFFKKPCLVLRKETEWIELVKNGTAKLVDADSEQLKKGFIHFVDLNKELDLEFPAFYGNCKTAEFILTETLQLFEN